MNVTHASNAFRVAQSIVAGYLLSLCICPVAMEVRRQNVDEAQRLPDRRSDRGTNGLRKLSSYNNLAEMAAMVPILYNTVANAAAVAVGSMEHHEIR
jgi:hypothetical protein